MKLTEKDFDHLAAGMFLFIHATERIINKMIQGYDVIDHDSQLYKQMCKRYGKVQADEWLHKTEKRIMLQSQGQTLHRWLDAAHKLIAATDQATEMGIMNKQDGATDMDVVDGLMSDSNMICRLFLEMENVHPDDYVKVESTIKLLWDKEHQPVNPELIDLFRPKLTSNA